MAVDLAPGFYLEESDEVSVLYVDEPRAELRKSLPNKDY